MLGDEETEVRPSRPVAQNGDDQLDDLRCWYPDDRKKHDTGTFEFGLVLAGAVSAGAYTAGVMDFLFQALDEWHRLRGEDENLPQHNVVLRVISGASAGGINGAIAAAACRYDFLPVTLGNANQRGPENPFFNTWVRGIQIDRLLDPSDLERGEPVRSVLNSESLDELAMSIAGLKGNTNNVAGKRGWLADPFKLLLTVTNLRGVPYEVRFSGNTGFGHEMVMHRDHMGFTVPVFRDPAQAPAPDLVPLTWRNSAKDPAWKLLATTALASGAFPLALASRSLSRPGSDYDYRYVFPHAAGGLVYSPPRIKSDEAYEFKAVDGGTMNNEPFELAHRELAGLKGRNPRTGETACRALIMVDPFTDPEHKPTKSDGSLLGTFLALMSAFKAQTRFKQIDLTLAEAEDVYSRFMIAPSRNGIKGSKAVASGGLSGFLGFFCEDYRMHDYMLGRENCQRFLRDWFVLPSDNALFCSWPQAALECDDFRSRSSHREGHRQIIPLVGKAAEPQKLDKWPAGSFGGFSSVEPAIGKRMNAASGPLASEAVNLICGGTKGARLRRAVVWLGAWIIWRFWLTKRLRSKIAQRLDEARDQVDGRMSSFLNEHDKERL